MCSRARLTPSGGFAQAVVDTGTWKVVSALVTVYKGTDCQGAASITSNLTVSQDGSVVCNSFGSVATYEAFLQTDGTMLMRYFHNAYSCTNTMDAWVVAINDTCTSITDTWTGYTSMRVSPAEAFALLAMARSTAG